MIHAANLAEQVSRRGGGPAPWLAAASRFLTAARAGVEVAPPVFDGGGRVMTEEQETALLGAYRSLLPKPDRRLAALPGETRSAPRVVAGGRASRAGGRVGARLAAAVPRPPTLPSARWPRSTRGASPGTSASASRGGGSSPSSSCCDGRHPRTASSTRRSAGARASRRARKRARDRPERLSGPRWTRSAGLRRARAGRLPGGRGAPPAPATTASGGLPQRFARYIGGLRANAERPMMQFYPGLGARPWHDPRAFAIVADLERLAPEIAAEARPASRRPRALPGRSRGHRARRALERPFPARDGPAQRGEPGALPGLRWDPRSPPGHAHHVRRASCATSRASTRGRASRSTRGRRTCGCDATSGSKCRQAVASASAGWPAAGRRGAPSSSTTASGTRCGTTATSGGWSSSSTCGTRTSPTTRWRSWPGFSATAPPNGAGAKKYWARNDAALERARRPAPATPDARATARYADDALALGELISAAMAAGDLTLAGARAARYAALCRGTRWYPVRRGDDPELPSSRPPGRLSSLRRSSSTTSSSSSTWRGAGS